MSQLLWGLGDNQGTVRDVVDYDDTTDSSTVVKHRKYDSFGNVTDDSDPNVDFLYSYTGREWDADADLYYYRARWYDANAGRFISEDPLGFGAGDMNVQRYVGNGGVNATDPSGLWGESGHFYTVYVVARLANYDHRKAMVLAYYAQYPDENGAYDAASIAKYNAQDFIFKSSELIQSAKDITAGRDDRNDKKKMKALAGKIATFNWWGKLYRSVHQLHGGDLETIKSNRKDISILFKQAVKDKDVQFGGVLLHAFGDSYAHTYQGYNGKSDAWRAFGPKKGHLFARGPFSGLKKRGHAVDQIRERYGDNVYPDYVRALSTLLGVPKENNAKIEELIGVLQPAGKLVNGKIRFRHTHLVRGSIRLKSSKTWEYSDATEIRKLKNFVVSNKKLNGVTVNRRNGEPDNYYNNSQRLLVMRSSQYYPETESLGTRRFGFIEFGKMNSFIDRMNAQFSASRAARLKRANSGN